MMQVTQIDIDSFKQFIENRMGLFLDATRISGLNELILTRIQVCRCMGFQGYLKLLEGPESAEELRVLSENITVGETYFFRHVDQFRAFIDSAVPERILRNGRRAGFEILSAGCASGEEAYTLSVLVHQNEALFRNLDVSIAGIDINPTSIKKARLGQYTDWALREMSPQDRKEVFAVEGKKYVVKDRYRENVTFEERNLLEDDRSFWLPGRFDVIFCRNVLMYFSTEKMRQVVGRLSRVLAPGGFLFLGPSETLRGLSTDFHLYHSHNVFYYQKKEDVELQRESPHFVPAPERVTELSRPLVSDLTFGSIDVTWAESISKSANYIESLSRKVRGTSAGFNEKGAAKSGFDIFIKVYDCFARERYQEAWETLQNLDPSMNQNPEILLLRAILLTNQGKADEAEIICESILRNDELNAGAHYLKALSREQCEDRPSAIEENNIAVYLDPTFAMAHFHLGMLLRKNGDGERAVSHLEKALRLFDIEKPVRIALFGGGFSRNALINLCRSELRNSER
ncbi:MAG: methyltransferase [Deltaproteobacteria bacterium]|nr:methyltransferase [Deltaproteobacteria bacterium]